MALDMERARIRSDFATELDRVRAVVREMAEPQLLDLCAARMGALLREVEWEQPAGLNERERAYLEFSERFATSPGTAPAEEMDRLLAHDPPEAVHAFIGALYTLRMTEHLALA